MSCHTHTHTHAHPILFCKYAPVAVRVKVTEHPLPPRRVRLPRPHRELARHRRPVLRPHHRPPRRAEHAGARFARARRQRLGPAAGPGVRLALLVRRRPSHEHAVLAEVLVGRQHRVGELLQRDAPGPVRVVPPEERLHLVVPHAVQEAPQPLLERRRPQVLRAVLGAIGSTSLKREQGFLPRILGGLGGVGKRRRRVSCAEAKGLHERAPQRARGLEHELFAEDLLTGWRETVGWCWCWWECGANGGWVIQQGRIEKECGTGGRGRERNKASERTRLGPSSIEARVAAEHRIFRRTTETACGNCGNSMCESSRCLQLVQTGRRDRATRHGAPPCCGPEPAQLVVALAARHRRAVVVVWQ